MGEKEIIYGLLVGGIGLFGGLMSAVLLRRRIKTVFERRLADARTEQTLLHARLEALQATAERQTRDAAHWRCEADQWRGRATELRVELAALDTLLTQERKQAADMINQLKDAREQLKTDFQVLAQRILDEKGVQLVERQRSVLSQLIDPLREQIGDFKRRVDDVYDKESRDRTALYTEIHHLKALNERIGQDALNLTRALKGDSKTRGNWGEVVLERVLEASGLQKGREYDVQVGLSDPNGRRFQPDVVIRLPDAKDVVIDAKVALNAYEAFHNAEGTQEKEKYLADHVEAMRAHIRSLSAKQYANLQGVCSLDFTLMFVPVEGAFLAAMEKESGLFTEALEKNVVMVTPSTLLVTLRTIHNIWRHEYQKRHAVEIARKAGALYDKFAGFVEALQEVGQMLDKARNAFRTAHDRLVGGRGNLVRRTQELKELGAKAAKELPTELIQQACEPSATDETDISSTLRSGPKP